MLWNYNDTKQAKSKFPIQNKVHEERKHSTQNTSQLIHSQLHELLFTLMYSRTRTLKTWQLTVPWKVILLDINISIKKRQIKFNFMTDVLADSKGAVPVFAFWLAVSIRSCVTTTVTANAEWIDNAHEVGIHTHRIKYWHSCMLLFLIPCLQHYSLQQRLWELTFGVGDIRQLCLFVKLFISVL